MEGFRVGEDWVRVGVRIGGMRLGVSSLEGDLGRDLRRRGWNLD